MASAADDLPAIKTAAVSADIEISVSIAETPTTTAGYRTPSLYSSPLSTIERYSTPPIPYTVDQLPSVGTNNDPRLTPAATGSPATTTCRADFQADRIWTNAVTPSLGPFGRRQVVGDPNPTAGFVDIVSPPVSTVSTVSTANSTPSSQSTVVPSPTVRGIPLIVDLLVVVLILLAIITVIGAIAASAFSYNQSTCFDETVWYRNMQAWLVMNIGLSSLAVSSAVGYCLYLRSVTITEKHRRPFIVYYVAVIGTQLAWQVFGYVVFSLSDFGGCPAAFVVGCFLAFVTDAMHIVCCVLVAVIIRYYSNRSS